jgi:hypothetical protein
VRLGGEEEYGSTALCPSCVIKSTNVEEGNKLNICYCFFIYLFLIIFTKTIVVVDSASDHNKLNCGHTTEMVDDMYYKMQLIKKRGIETPDDDKDIAISKTPTVTSTKNVVDNNKGKCFNMIITLSL